MDPASIDWNQTAEEACIRKYVTFHEADTKPRGGADSRAVPAAWDMTGNQHGFVDEIDR